MSSQLVLGMRHVGVVDRRSTDLSTALCGGTSLNGRHSLKGRHSFKGRHKAVQNNVALNDAIVGSGSFVTTKPHHSTVAQLAPVVVQSNVAVNDPVVASASLVTLSPRSNTLAQLALRDDYDPIVFLFCANAIFISVLLNVLNYGVVRDDDGIKIPDGGLSEMLRRTRVGVFDYFRKPFQQVLMTDELKAAVEELKEARTNASLMRSSPSAQEAALRFMAARRKAISAGLAEDSALLSAESAPEE